MTRPFHCPLVLCDRFCCVRSRRHSKHSNVFGPSGRCHSASIGRDLHDFVEHGCKPSVQVAFHLGHFLVDIFTRQSMEVASDGTKNTITMDGYCPTVFVCSYRHLVENVEP